MKQSKLVILYEHPSWFDGLFAALDRKGLSYKKLLATECGLEKPGELILNRVGALPETAKSNPGFLSYFKDYLALLENYGCEVINGHKSYLVGTSKLQQQGIFNSLGLNTPKTKPVWQEGELSTDGLSFPVLIKPNVGGSGSDIQAFDKAPVIGASYGVDSLALLQDYLTPDDGYICRIEVLDGKLLYGLKLPFEKNSFNYCPADGCHLDGGRSVHYFDPEDEVIQEAVRAIELSGSDLGGVEYLVCNGERVYYDLNPLSNFAVDAAGHLGRDPNEILVDYLVARQKA